MNIQTIFETSVDQFIQWSPSIAAALVVFSVFYLVGQLVRTFILHATAKVNIDPHLSTLMARAARIGILILGLITALGTLGLDITAIVAGLGLTGFALGFALKDTISNLLAGVLILIYRPFKIGDTIKVAGFEGEVKAIDLRYTTLASEGDQVFIPNAKLFTDPITVCGND